MDAIALLRATRRRRDAAEQVSRQRAQDDLRQRAKAAAAAIRTIPGVRSISLFGSLARGTAKPGSDIDLVVWGMPVLEEDRAWAMATRAAGTDHVDILRGEDLPDHLLMSVRMEAVEP